MKTADEILDSSMKPLVTPAEWIPRECTLNAMRAYGEQVKAAAAQEVCDLLINRIGPGTAEEMKRCIKELPLP